MKKRIAGLVLSLFLAGTILVACGEDKVSSSSSSASSSSPIPATSSSSSTTPGEYKISLGGQRLVEVGQSMQLSPTVYGPDNRVSYFISDPDLARVDENGLVTTKKAGFVTVTATAVGSDTSNPVTASFPFFIEPSYFARMVESGQSYDLSSGLKVEGTLKYCYSPSSGAIPESTGMTLPYALSLYKDPVEGLMGDFHIDLGDGTFLVTMALQSITGEASTGNATRIGLSYFGNNEVTLYISSGEAHDTICYYKKISLTKDLASLVVDKLVSSLSSSSSSSLITPTLIKNLFTNGLEALDLSSYPGLIDTAIMFDTDPSVGIYAYSDHLATVQTYIDGIKTQALAALKETYKDDPATGEVYGSIVGGLFPTALQDIRFTFSLKEDGSFKGINLVIKDIKEKITYKYLDISFSRNEESFDTTYLPALKTSLTKAIKEKVALDDCLALKEVVKQDLLASSLIMAENKIGKSTAADKSHSAYDAIHFSPSFIKDLQAYRLAVTNLKDSTSDTYVSNAAWISESKLDEFLPYASFSVSSVSDSLNNSLPDKYETKVGDSFLLSSFLAAGSNEESASIADADISFSFTNSAKKAYPTTDYSYDTTTHILTINALPSKDDTLVITSKSGSYKALTYRLTLKAPVA